MLNHHNCSFDEQSSAPLCMISGWSGPIWLVALYDLFDEDGLLFVWIVLGFFMKSSVSLMNSPVLRKYSGVFSE